MRQTTGASRHPVPQRRRAAPTTARVDQELDQTGCAKMRGDDRHPRASHWDRFRYVTCPFVPNRAPGLDPKLPIDFSMYATALGQHFLHGRPPASQGLFMINQLWRVVLSSSVVLGAAYLCGYVYHQSDMAAWGFDPALFPIGPQETYVMAFLAFMTAISYPLIWLNQLPTAWGVSIVVGVLLLPFVAAWISTRRLVRGWNQQFRRFICRSDKSLIGTERGARWAFVFSTAIFGVPLAMAILALASFIVIALPLGAARSRAHEDWTQKVFQKWPAVRWADETGKWNDGYLKTCSAEWCAIVQDGRAIAVPLASVRKVERPVPMGSNATN